MNLDDLPRVVRDMLPSDAVPVFLRAANETGGDENAALAAGWAEVRKGWQRPKIGKKWVKRAGFGKDGPSVSDVHVPTTEGDDKKKKPKISPEARDYLKDPEIIKEADMAAGNVTINIHQAGPSPGLASAAVEKASLHDGRARIVKVDTVRKIAYGWANVITSNGASIEDAQGDVIEPGDLVKFTTEFMIDERIGKTNHDGEPTHMVVHSMPLTYELAKAFGIDTPDEGWLVGVYIHDADTLAKVESGDLAAFSIGGSGERVAIS